MTQFARLAQRFPRKRVFITGAGSGLGLALAQALAKDGWSLGLFDHNLAKLTVVEEELSSAGVQVLAYPGDVTHADELTVAVNTFATARDGLDVMINNAGVSCAGSLMETSLDNWQWIVGINMMGVVHGCRAAIPHLQRNGSGLLINVASAAAFASAPGMIAYNATKAAVLSISESLCNELSASRTQVSVVMPTFFRSSILDSFRGSEEARARAEEVIANSGLTSADIAREIIEGASNSEIYIVLPSSARWLWRFKRWLPRTFLKNIVSLRERMRMRQS